MSQVRSASEGLPRGPDRSEKEILRTSGVRLVERNAEPPGQADRLPEGYEITLVQEGECTLRTGGRSIRLGRGDLCLIHPGEPHALLSRRDAPARLLTLRCERAFIERLLRGDFPRRERPEASHDERGDPLVDLGPHFASLSRAALPAADILQELRLSRQPEHPSEVLLVHARILTLLGTLLSPRARAGSEFDGAATASGKREAVEELAQAMAGLDLSEMRAERLAARLNLSLRHFTRLFRERTGKSFTQYVTDIRIQRAKELLASTDSKLIEIAQRVGYRSLSQFNLIFKRRTGFSPNQYRRRFQLDNS